MGPPMPRDYKAKVILGWTTLHFAEETESWECIETLLNGGASTRDLGTTKRKLNDPNCAPSVVSEICRRGCLKLLRFALSENPALVDMELEMNRTLLHVAAQSGSSIAVRCLLDYTVNVNATDGRGVTPLHEAAAHCDSHILMLLLKAGADAQAKDIDGRTALHYAASGGSVSGIRVLLSEGLAPDVESSNGCSPLHEAASSSNHHCVQLLLNAGADLYMTTNSGWTALHWAANKGTVRALRILLDAGIPVGSRTHQDETPLHLAAERGASDMVTILVNAGADVEAVDSSGRTPAKRASDSILQKEKETTTAAAADREMTIRSKPKSRPKQGINKCSQKSGAAFEPENSLNSRRSESLEVLQGDDAQSYCDEMEGSEYSFQSESEISGQRYSDTGNDFDEEYNYVEPASGGIPINEKPPPLLSVETNIKHSTNKGREYVSRGKYRGRGRGNFRGQTSDARGGGHMQTQAGRHQQWNARGGSTKYQDRGQHAGNVQQKEHKRRHHSRHHEKNDGETARDYDRQDSSGETMRKEHHFPTAGDDPRRKHPGSNDRQKQTCDERQFPQNVVPDSGGRNQQRHVAYGSTEQLNRGKTNPKNVQESKSGGTFLDELRFLQEKLASMGGQNTQPQKPNQSQYNRPPKPGV